MYTYKKNLTILFPLLLHTLTTPLQAANILYTGEDDQKEGSYTPIHFQKQATIRDYTILNNKNINHALDDIEEVEDDLEGHLFTINQKLVATNNQPTPLILGAVLQHQQNQEYLQYLITNTGLLSKNTQPNAVKRAHKKGFHLIQADPEHVILQLLTWLQLSQHYIVKALHTNKPICQHCYFIANTLWGKELQTNEKGCLNMPFPLLDKMPNLARQYIDIHFNLPFIQKFLIPMMGYITNEGFQKAIQQKDKEIAAFIASMQTIKDEQIAMLSKQVKKKDIQLNKTSHCIEALSNQLNDKNKEINNYRAYLLKEITAKLNRLRNKFNITLDDIDIQNGNSIKNFAQKASLVTKEGHKQLNEDMQTLRKWHAKYKGNDWKYFNTKNNDGYYWGCVYVKIEKKMKEILRKAEKDVTFSSILQLLKTLCSTNQAHLLGINEVFEENNLQNEHYRMEVSRMNAKLQRCTRYIWNASWRWQE